MKTITIADKKNKKHVFYKKDNDVRGFIDENLWLATWGEPEEVKISITKLADETIKGTQRVEVIDLKTKVILKNIIVKDVTKAIPEIVASGVYGEAGIDYEIRVTKITSIAISGLKTL